MTKIELNSDVKKLAADLLCHSIGGQAVEPASTPFHVESDSLNLKFDSIRMSQVGHVLKVEFLLDGAEVAYCRKFYVNFSRGDTVMLNGINGKLELKIS
jgi:hypothetical protein